MCQKRDKGEQSMTMGVCDMGQSMVCGNTSSLVGNDTTRRYTYSTDNTPKTVRASTTSQTMILNGNMATQ